MAMITEADASGKTACTTAAAAAGNVKRIEPLWPEAISILPSTPA
jgi:hypothetical protein